MPAPSSLTEWNASVRFRDARLRRKWSQAELARELNLSPATIANWEHRRSQPHSSQIEKICDVLGIKGEIKAFLYRLALADSSHNIELTPRENALCLALAELHYGSIWKWEPLILPGITQVRAYQEQILKVVEELTEQLSRFGWTFKKERQSELKQRRTKYRMSILIGSSVFFHLKDMELADRREQVEYLRECNAREGWEIRVMHSASTLPGPFEVYVPGDSPTAGPPFVYTEIHDLSWCIEERDRVQAYHELIKKNWKHATPLKEFLDAERDRLA
ncbi:helix-turn-helix domain-containing protein [Glycomyces terrestris]|nr:Scr1 family TA system antitoxin-like transcriptional regulator [Glycomyces terrestris]